MFARYFMSTLEEAFYSSSDYDDVTASVHPVNGCSCMRTCKSTHAEDDPTVESQAAVLCGNARRHLVLSILLPTLRPRPLQPARPSIVVHSPSFPPMQSSFFSALSSLRVRSTPRVLLFRFCSTRLFVLA